MLGDRLEKLRTALKLDWGELGGKLGLSRTMIHYLRSGEREPGMKLLRLIEDTEAGAGLAQPKGPVRTVGSVTAREDLAYREIPKQKLEAEVKSCVDHLQSAPPGRARIAVLSEAINILVELRERCFDEWSGTIRDKRVSAPGYSIPPPAMRKVAEKRSQDYGTKGAKQ